MITMMITKDDALHSLIEKGKKSKLRKRSDVSQKITITRGQKV